MLTQFYVAIWRHNEFRQFLPSHDYVTSQWIKLPDALQNCKNYSRELQNSFINCCASQYKNWVSKGLIQVIIYIYVYIYIYIYTCIIYLLSYTQKWHARCINCSCDIIGTFSIVVSDGQAPGWCERICNHHGDIGHLAHIRTFPRSNVPGLVVTWPLASSPDEGRLCHNSYAK